MSQVTAQAFFFLSLSLRIEKAMQVLPVHITETAQDVGKAVERRGAHSTQKLNKLFALVLEPNKIDRSSIFD